MRKLKPKIAGDSNQMKALSEGSRDIRAIMSSTVMKRSHIEVKRGIK